MIDPESPPWWTRALAPLYRLGSETYHGLFDWDVLHAERLPRPVISVGNVVTGGTGKTPVVAALAEAAEARSLRTAVLTRGYGGRRRGTLRDGRWEEGIATAREAGDEALWLSRRLPGVPVVVNARRGRAARDLLSSGEPVDLFLLDDGFQHRRLHRDADLVIFDARAPWSNGRRLPAGPLREGRGALRRAGHLLVMGEAPTPTLPDALSAWKGPWTAAWRVTGDAQPLGEGGVAPGPHPVCGVAGIARPWRFRDRLRGQAWDIRAWHSFPDHHPFTEEEVHDLEEEARSLGAALVTTEKDAVRLEGLIKDRERWWVLPLRLEVERGWIALLDRLLGNRS